MSVSSRTPVPGPPAAATGDSLSPGARETTDRAGLVFARLTVTTTLLALSFLLASFPLLVLGRLRPAPVIALSLIVAAVIVPLGLRRVPGLVPGAALADDGVWAVPGGRGGKTPWWTLASLVAIAVAFFADQVVYHSQFLIITRDPGSYMQFATWLAGHGSLPINPDLAAFGGAPHLWFQSFAEYQVGTAVVPQFMAGLPMALAVGFWLGGVNAALLAGPLFGAAAVLTFGGLAARLLGARWAPLAALVLAVSLPQQFTSRSTYSETLAQVLFLGGLSLVIDSLRVSPGASRGSAGSGGRLARRAIARMDRWDPGRVLAALAGLAFGITLLVRLDGPADVLPLIPYCGLLIVRGQRQGLPLLIGLVIGWAYGVYDGLVLTWPYVMKTNITSVKPLVEIIALIVVATAVGMLVLRRRLRKRGSLPQVGGVWWLPRWLPAGSMVVPFVVMAAFGARSHFQTDYVKEQYAQLSLHWVYWYVGGPVLALATAGAAAILYGCLRGRWPGWTLPLMTFTSTIVVFLYRPGITPDQPWASRRMVPAVLPGFLLFAVWAVASVTRQIRESAGIGGALWGAAARIRGLRRVASARITRALTSAGVAFLCAVGFLAPTVVTTFGLSFHGGGPLGVRIHAHGLAFKRTYTGEVAAIYGLCARIPEDSSVLIIDGDIANRMAEVVRGMCGVPVARFHDQSATSHAAAVPAVLAAIRGVERAGRRPVLLAGYWNELKPYKNGTVTKAMTLRSDMDEHIFLSKPFNVISENMDIWMWEPTR